MKEYEQSLGKQATHITIQNILFMGGYILITSLNVLYIFIFKGYNFSYLMVPQVATATNIEKVNYMLAWLKKPKGYKPLHYKQPTVSVNWC